jgi:hypothetical protein
MSDNAAFATPAETLSGAVEKLRIPRPALGEFQQEGADELECFQDYDDPWFPRVIADLERLAGPGAGTGAAS